MLLRNPSERKNTFAVFIEKKNPHISEPMKFKPVFIKGQLDRQKRIEKT